MMDSASKALLGITIAWVSADLLGDPRFLGGSEVAVIVQEVHADGTATVRYAYGAVVYTVPVAALFERRTS